ncbi:SDR family NAD(P)-dependent oxidoreductase [Halieaceae bacterium IMCC8485]|jgi:NAD(P)-dependent dehydrogenase (short-subunit alcohol dehydrogenase family)|uniref:SDR family NAD(P)-dependent oxidoreductase n=1 Tax=Candidatus Seongchinamella marina TaxID=2518990 RepID=A0ABT3SSX2_9GAMM|nr:SDR family NAD(P)-dependent oxidoreductase [Candidatus Seongchinamella marina]MBT5005963.1 SDR family NAD(P)-dependent oxidoreductase [Halieaceae bacterium]MCX2973088.1 SDR family NAD(P)-dependent oxidoreductase [Candidatus Seongchinamella marina]
MTRTVLITGCSSGIGRSLALELHNRGLKVYATARRPETLDDLEQRGLKILGLDVNDDASIAAAMTQVESDVGQLDMLVNNAGFSQVGAIVDLQREDLRQQYETNVIAPVAVTRAALPLMRKAVAANGAADLVNVGSIVGLLTTPFAGAYCSSKACVHSITDALRMELAPFGIRTITIQPGGVRSSFGDHAEEGMRLPEGSVYEPMQARIQARAQAGQQGATPTDEFIKPVVDKLLKAKPPMVIRGGKGSFLLVTLKRLLPARAFDQLMAKRFGLAGFQPGEG